MYATTCWRCGTVISLPFQPKTGKVCNKCYYPRSSEEVEAAQHDTTRLRAAQGLGSTRPIALGITVSEISYEE